jgi:lysophospholipase L1-like esterase
VWLIGDGSMAVAEESYVCGCGEALNEHLAKGVIVHNEAKKGMSLKSFVDNGGVKQLQKLPTKAVVLLQLGGNDLNDLSPEQYSSLDVFVRRFQTIVKTARENKLQLVLCTPLARPYYHEGSWVDRLGGYDDVVRRLAQHLGLPLLDLEVVTREWWMSMSEVEASMYYIASVENEAFLLTEEGAKKVAEMAADVMRSQRGSKIKKIVKK